MKHSDQLGAVFRQAVQLCRAVKASALVLMAEQRFNWQQLRGLADGTPLVVAADTEEILRDVGTLLPAIAIGMADAPVYDRIGQALIKAVAHEMLVPGAAVVVIYCGLEPDEVDSISVVDLGDHLGRLSVRDLRRLETSVPLDTLQTVVALGLEIGREGREGKPVGALFVVGDTRKVLASSHPTGFDPVKGYNRKERNLKIQKVREGIKEIAQMDGAIIVAPDGTVEAAARYIDASASDINLTKGLGSRHWTGAAITRNTKAIAVVVSESSGTVRIFHGGELVMRIEPFRRAMVWRDFDSEPSEEPRPRADRPSKETPS
ncbi:MAG: diadenylate cyclase [Pirellulales bacterium]|nr:diadenylate cyclase [Pirellulales bacterium]